jgi:hypothetical protein
MAILSQKKEIVLRHEQLFANSIGAAVFEKPRVTFWMILIPLLFLYFIYRMQRFKLGRMKFDEEFMTTRRRVMDAALNALETNSAPDIDEIVRNARLPEPLQPHFSSWMKALAAHYTDLLAGNGDSFDSLVRTAYSNRAAFLQTFNRMNALESEFYAAIKPHLGDVEGATDIITAIEARSRQLHHEMADRIFPES